MKKKFINIYIFLSLVILLSSCSKGKVAEINDYDNSSFYDSFSHNLVEKEDGYYTLYKELLVFVDRESLKPYLVSKEKNSIEDLISDDSKRVNSDAYFQGGEWCFLPIW